MTRRARSKLIISIVFLIAVASVPAGLLAGGVDLDISRIIEAFTGKADQTVHFIVIESRLPALLTAMFAGAALAVAGLIMQTCFANPLAGPSIMGISSGASLGVAIVIMMLGSVVGFWGNMAVIGGAFLGAMLVLGIILLFASFVNSSFTLLIVGILIGYLTSSLISLLNFFSADSAVHAFVVWGMGSFSGVNIGRVPMLAFISVALIICAMLYHRSLDALCFGEQFAGITGIDVSRARTGLILLSGALTAIVTALCGPVGFIGLVVPHIARRLISSGSHSLLVPATAATGALLGILCQIISVAPSLVYGSVIPVNAITPLFGVPVILYVLLRGKNSNR